LKAEYIRELKSPILLQVMFVSKKDKTSRIIIDYQQLNNAIKDNIIHH